MTAPDVRVAIDAAEKVARESGLGYVSTTHLLFGLLADDECLASRVLKALKVDVERLRKHISPTDKTKEGVAETRLHYTRRSKKVLELALREMLGLGDESLGSQHLLLALLHETESAAADALRQFKVVYENKAVVETIRRLTESSAS